MFRENFQIGPYTLIKKLGRGGFGEVWFAERRAKFVTTKVALKLPLEEQVDTDAIKHEAVLWEQASGHPNVLPIIDADEYDGQIVIVSEYAPDGSLAELLQKEGALSTRKAVELAIGILSGLEFLHSKKIIHRDIKPANILLQGETPRLADFGISRVMKTTSVSINMSGTPSYMAPEAFDRKRTMQTDIWSVGVILYEMLKGSLPFPHINLTDLLGAIIRDEPESLPDSTPSSLQEIVLKSLDKKPENRYQTAREMRDDLADFLVKVSQQNIQPTLIKEQLPPTVPTFQPVQTQPDNIIQTDSPVLNTGEESLIRKHSLSDFKRLSDFETKENKTKTSASKFIIPAALLFLVGSLAGIFFLVKNIAFSGSSNTNTQAAVVKEAKLIPYNKGGRFGYCDENKKIIIEPKYNFAAPFSDGVAVVTPNKKAGLIDRTGKEIIAAKYDYISDFVDGVASMRFGGYPEGKSGLIDKTGKEIVPPKYDYIGEFKEGLARVSLNKKIGFIDKNGSEVIPVKYDNANDFSEGLAPVNIGEARDKEGYISKIGKWGYVDKTGKEVIPVKYQYATPFSEGLATVSLNDSPPWLFINPNGDTVITIKQASSVGPLFEGYAWVSYDYEKYGYIDKFGNKVISPKYNQVSGFQDGMAYTRMTPDGKYGFIDKTGREITPMIYDQISGFAEGLCAVNVGRKYNKEGEATNKGKWGFIDKTGKEIIPTKYDSWYVGEFKDGLVVVSINEEQFYIDKNGTEYYEP